MNRLLESGLNPLRGPCAALAAKYMVLPIRSVDKREAGGGRREAGGGRREAGGGRRECRKVSGASLTTHLSSLALPSSPHPASLIPHPASRIPHPCPMHPVLPALIASDTLPRTHAMEQCDLERELGQLHSESWGWPRACC